MKKNMKLLLLVSLFSWCECSNAGPFDSLKSFVSSAASKFKDTQVGKTATAFLNVAGNTANTTLQQGLEGQMVATAHTSINSTKEKLVALGNNLQQAVISIDTQISAATDAQTKASLQATRELYVKAYNDVSRLNTYMDVQYVTNVADVKRLEQIMPTLVNQIVPTLSGTPCAAMASELNVSANATLAYLQNISQQNLASASVATPIPGLPETYAAATGVMTSAAGGIVPLANNSASTVAPAAAVATQNPQQLLSEAEHQLITLEGALPGVTFTTQEQATQWKNTNLNTLQTYTSQLNALSIMDAATGQQRTSVLNKIYSLQQRLTTGPQLAQDPTTGASSYKFQ
ncbi:MAG: hypothetical protein LBB63_03300 [Holosporaceae bacterium]|jgi:hypothetical protein|nr:hypothetical protein [Holosporaceae bacterium]